MKIVAEPGVPQVVVTREFRAPRELLFRAYAEPFLVKRWLGPAELELVVNQLDPRHGGRWRWTHYDKAGKGYAFHGLYHGDPTPERIVQTYEFDHAPGTVYLNLITFDERDGVTTLTQNTVFFAVEDRDRYVAGGMDRGLRASMAKLDELVNRLAEEAR
ncbi:SRPBCC domain-containing protein [Kribbella sp. NPDC048915]|uniref:SRPBCC domain-containing protein n=1 Tax=Kribbella sp. NPDC048915 TaxID=3155148 RepID=UPI0033CD37A5